QHHARGCTAFAHVLLRLPDATAATGRHITPGPLPGEVLSWCRILRLDLAPIALKLFSHELREARQGPLPHFRPGNPNNDLVVGPDHHPDIDFSTFCCRSAGHLRCRERNMEAERQTARSRS